LSKLFEENSVIVKGTVKKVLFAALDSGYGIIKVVPEGRNERPVTLVGEIAGVSEGETVKAEGKWVEHPKFGPQVRVKDIQVLVPESLAGIKGYIVGNLRGIGPNKADLIIARWGENTLKVIEETPEKLKEVPGISGRIVEDVKEDWENIREMRKLSLFLHQYGHGTPGLTAKIWKNWGWEAVERIENNCYDLVTLYGIGFKTADSIGQAMGIKKDSRQRLLAGLLHTLQSAEENGHTYLPYTELVERATKILQVDDELVEKQAGRLDGHSKVVVEDENYYWWTLYRAEKIVAHQLVLLSKKMGKASKYKDKIIKGLDDTVLDDHQKKAVLKGLETGLVCVTGGPGTGKTRTIRETVLQTQKFNLSIALAAPTGRAAKRMSEGLLLEGRTIHRLLGYKPSSNTFTMNKTNQLEYDIIIIDEMSMTDTWLARHLFEAIHPNTTVFLVGDADQLPSVGPGRVFSEIIDANLPVERFSHIYRTGEGSDIAHGAAMINEGKFPIVTGPGKSELVFINIEDAEEAAYKVVRYASQRIQELYDVSPKDTQVLAPLYKGVAGIENLNKMVQENLNPHGKDVIPGKGLRLGDRCLQLKNNYNLDDGRGVFNGDIGYIVDFEPNEKTVFVDFGDRIVKYKGTDLEGLAPAWAMSIHKAQGSEFDAVVLPILTSQYIFLERSIFYTAVSRGKKVVCLVGSKKAINIAVKKIDSRVRYTDLAKKIRSEKLNPSKPGEDVQSLF
jgi:exodeoxyribonuclease V alpha subunit